MPYWLQLNSRDTCSLCGIDKLGSANNTVHQDLHNISTKSLKVKALQFSQNDPSTDEQAELK